MDKLEQNIAALELEHRRLLNKTELLQTQIEKEESSKLRKLRQQLEGADTVLQQLEKEVKCENKRHYDTMQKLQHYKKEDTFQTYRAWTRSDEEWEVAVSAFSIVENFQKNFEDVRHLIEHTIIGLFQTHEYEKKNTNIYFNKKNAIPFTRYVYQEVKKAAWKEVSNALTTMCVGNKAFKLALAAKTLLSTDWIPNIIREKKVVQELQLNYAYVPEEHLASMVAKMFMIIFVELLMPLSRYFPVRWTDIGQNNCVWPALVDNTNTTVVKALKIQCTRL